MAPVTLKSIDGKWIMASSILASSMAFIDSTALNVVLPSLQESLDAKGTDLFWILNAYLLMLASFILLGGSLGDKLGRKKIFIVGILIFISGSALCGFAPTVNYLIAFRMLQGLGGALMIPGSLSLISASFSAKERGKAIGTWSAFTTIVTIGGPIIGGALGDAGLWRYIFFINIPIGLISIFILWFKVKESRDEGLDHSLDYPGAIATVIGLALLTFGFLRIPDVGFQNWQVYISLGGGILVIAIFIFIENKSKHPMMPLGLFSNKTFSGANLLTFFLYAGLGAGILFLTLNMVQIQGYSQLQAGLTLLPFTILMILIARFAGSLADKYGPRWLLILGPAVAGVGLLLLSFVKQTSGTGEYWTTFFPGIFCFGLGMSFTVAPLTVTVMGALPNHFAGTASGVNNAMTRISSVFANAIFGSLAVLFFSAFLNKEIAQLSLDNSSQLEVLAQASALGNAQVPISLKRENKIIVKRAYKNAFIASYGKIMKLCSLLAFLGAFMSLIFIKNNAAIVTDS
ncbi:MAG: MFS transporter [Bacteroidota bacterium]|nr:MFS transporter [Bacteroidota bacterium]